MLFLGITVIPMRFFMKKQQLQFYVLKLHQEVRELHPELCICCHCQFRLRKAVT